MGENLQDHSKSTSSTAAGTGHPQQQNGPPEQTDDCLRWFVVQGHDSGQPTTLKLAVLSVRSRVCASPDIQFTSCPLPCRYDGKKPIKGHGFMVLTGAEQTKSRVYVRLRSADPYEHPEILFNYLQREEDREGFRRCVRLTREIIGQPAMDRFRDTEITHGTEREQRCEIDAFVRENLESTYHPCGSCHAWGGRYGSGGFTTASARVEGLRLDRLVCIPDRAERQPQRSYHLLARRAADLVRLSTGAPVNMVLTPTRQRALPGLAGCTARPSWRGSCSTGRDESASVRPGRRLPGRRSGPASPMTAGSCAKDRRTQRERVDRVEVGARRERDAGCRQACRTTSPSRA